MKGGSMKRATVEANEVRSTGPRFDRWPSSVPFVSYVTVDGAFLCVTCANGGNGSRSGDELDASCPDDHQWRVIGAQVNSEPTECAHCARTIPVAE